jgi:uncharacterized protein YcfJ
LVIVPLAACSGMSTRHKNMATGAVVGGVVGNQIDPHKK